MSCSVGKASSLKSSVFHLPCTSEPPATCQPCHSFSLQIARRVFEPFVATSPPAPAPDSETVEDRSMRDLCDVEASFRVVKEFVLGSMSFTMLIATSLSETNREGFAESLGKMFLMSVMLVRACVELSSF